MLFCLDVSAVRPRGAAARIGNTVRLLAERVSGWKRTALQHLVVHTRHVRGVVLRKLRLRVHVRVRACASRRCGVIVGWVCARSRASVRALACVCACVWLCVRARA